MPMREDRGQTTGRTGMGVVLGMLLAAGPLALGAGPHVAATEGHPRGVDNLPGQGFTLLPGTVELEPALEDAVIEALSDAQDSLPEASYFAFSGLRLSGDWAFVSVVGTQVTDAEVGWRLEDATFWGLVIAQRDGDGRFFAAVEGTEDYSDLINTVPDDILSPRARVLLDPRLRDDARADIAATSYIFPFAKNYSIYYGTKGVHSADFSSMWGTGTWKAVDWWSDGASGHAPNAVYAAAAESITGAICADGVSTAIKTPQFIYAHFAPSYSFSTGQSFTQGQFMGALQTGSFSASCGYASQTTGTWHLHWGFPNASLTVEGWTLNPASGTSAPWVKGSTSKPPGTWVPVTWEGSATPTGEVIVDDKAAGFVKYGTSTYWYEASIGYSGHMYWTYVNGSTRSNYARWTPALSSLGAGNYKVCAYIPSNYATSQKAKYKVYHSGQTHTFTINQNNYYDQWVCSTSSYAFSANGTEYVELSDATGEAASTKRMLGFDAVKFVKN